MKLRRIIQSEIDSFYMWAVAHDAIQVPISDEGLNPYQRWAKMTERARELICYR